MFLSHQQLNSCFTIKTGENTLKRFGKIIGKAANKLMPDRKYGCLEYLFSNI